MDKILFDKETFSKQLVKRRKDCGYSSQQSFASAFNARFRNGNSLDGNNPTSGILGTIKHYEDPKHKSMPRLDIVVEMCQLLDCDIDYLLGKIEEPKHIYQAMRDQCGLSNAATEQLIYWNTHGGKYIETLNLLLVSANFDHALYHAAELMKAKPVFIGLSEIYGKWQSETYSQPKPPEGYPNGSGLREMYSRAETKYDIEKLRLSEYLTFLVSELESISMKDHSEKGG